MLLEQWRKDNGLTQEGLASALGVHQTTVASWERRGRRPRAEHIATIVNVTSGAVTANDFYDLPPTGDAA